jgi:CHAD domain-containing protein
MKKLRYSLEFFEGLYGPFVRDVIASLVRIQDRLGEHQDAVVAGAHLRDAVDQVGADLPPRTLFTMGALAERYDRRARRLRRGFPKVYAGLDAKSWRRLERQMTKGRPPAWSPPRPRSAAPADSLPAIAEPEAPPSTSI